MMKSFFKKLAFVMALAMVVSTATPAASVFAADAAGIALQTAKSDAEILASDNVAVGATVDYKFYGAPKNWKTMGLKWTSSNEAVATVAQDGKITGVADGVATIELKSEDGTYAVAIEITVGAGDVTKAAYEVAQVSHIQAKITLNNGATYTKEDLVLTRVYDGGFEVNWPVKEFKQKDNVITFEPYVAFADGDNYLIKLGADDKGTAFATTLGKVDFVEVTYKTLDMGDMGKGKAYTGGEDGEELTVQLSAQLYSNGVNVTKAPGYSTEDVVYTLAEDNENVMIDEYAGSLVFSKAGEYVVVNASYVYYDENDDEQKVTAPTPIVSELVPAYEITGVKEWTVAEGDYLTGDEEINWSKPVHSVPAGENVDYKIVALLTDNYGNIISTVNGLEHSIDDVVDVADSKFAAEGYYVEYASANVDKLLVGTDGELTTFVKATVPVLISLHNSTLETEDQLVRTLFAASVGVKDARKFDKVSINTSSITLLTEGSYNEEEVTLRVYDQYGDEWTSEAVSVDVSCSVEGVTGLPTFSDFTRKGVYEFDGGDIDSPKSTFTLTFKINDSKTATLKVNLKDPKFEKDGVTVKITSYSLAADGKSQTVEKASDLSSGNIRKSDIRYYTLSNGYKYGVVEEINGAALTFVKNADDLKLTTSDAIKGQQYIVVYDPDGKIVGLSDDNQYGLGIAPKDGLASKLTMISAAADEDGKMHYATVGTYTVKVLQVSSFNKKDEAVFSTKYSTSFKITNENKAVKFLKQSNIETAKTDINDIVADTIVFSLGGSEWKKFTAAMVADVEYAENEKSGYIVIKNVTLNVPLNGSTDSIYYTVKVDVNKAVKVPTGFDWED